MTKNSKKMAIVALALAALSAGSATAFAGSGWSITDIGTLTAGDMSYATGINNSGQVVGWSGYDSTQTTAFIWENGTMSAISSTAGLRSVATGINNAGQVSGYAAVAASNGTSYYNDHAFIYSKTTGMQDLGSPYGGTNSAAYAINNSGLVGGSGQTTLLDSQNKPTIYHATTWSGSASQSRDLGLLSSQGYEMWGGPWSRVNSVNDSGVSAGYASTGKLDLNGDPAGHAVIWDANGVIKDLGTLGDCAYATSKLTCSSAAFGINAAGQVVGVSGDENNDKLRPFLYSNGKMTDLGTLTGATNGYAYAINNNGQVVGFSSDYKTNATDPTTGSTGSTNFTTATLWTVDANGNAVITDLNSLVAGSGWELWGATGINDKGQIVGYGMLGEGANATFHAFLLSPDTATPTPLPPALYLFGSALTGLWGVRRRSRK